MPPHHQYLRSIYSLKPHSNATIPRNSSLLISTVSGAPSYTTWIMSSYYHSVCTYSGFSRWPSGKESVCKAGATGDTGSIPGLRRTPGRGNGNPLQSSWLENPMDRGAWLAPAHGVLKSQTQLKRLSIHSWTCTNNSASVPSPLPTWGKGYVFMPLHLPLSPPPSAQVLAYS